MDSGPKIVSLPGAMPMIVEIGRLSARVQLVLVACLLLFVFPFWFPDFQGMKNLFSVPI